MNMHIAHGDCLDVLKIIPDASVTAIVTDPPYALEFMGKGWDKVLPSVDIWRECLRVLKPGGVLLAFGGTRTFHRLTCAIEDAGFEIRDCLSWLYGSGFPKSLDISKAIDKAGGCNPAEVAHILRARREAAGMTREEVASAVGCTPASVRDWEEGRARAAGRAIENITPSEEYRIKLADLLGYTKDERRASGVTVDRRGDGTGYGLGHSGRLMEGCQTDSSRPWAGYGTALKPAWEPIVFAMKPTDGTFAANALTYGVAGINVDGCRVPGSVIEERGESWAKSGVGKSGAWHGTEYVETKSAGERTSPLGRWPANVVHDGSDEVVNLFPESNGSGSARILRRGTRNDGWGMQDKSGVLRDAGTGSASRFFYCAKASKSDRGEGNTHPTVKPVELMRWLVRMVKMPTGTLVLDPFAGSGSTGVACALEGVDFIGIEREAEYVQIAQRRIEGAA